MDLLEVKDLRVLYGKAIALNGVSLLLREKEMVGVMGPNGAGKTTLLRAVSAVVPVGGEIRYNGVRIDRLPAHEVVGMGIVHCPERRQLFHEFTVIDNLEMGAFLRKKRQDILQDFDYVYNLFPILRLRRNQRAGTLSGGEQQMLSIGRSIMSNPRLLMLDEPTMGLAPVMKSALADGIRNIWARGMTLLFVEQDANLTLGLAERVYILEHGKIGLEGKSKELINNEEIKRVYFALG